MQRLIGEGWFWWSASASGFISAVLAETPIIVYALMCIMAIDIAVGLMAAAIRGEISKERAFRGAVRKAIVLGIVGASALIQLEMSLFLRMDVEPLVELPTDIPFTKFVTGVFMLYEFISILENAKRAGVRLPGPVVRILRSERGTVDAE